MNTDFSSLDIAFAPLLQWLAVILFSSFVNRRGSEVRPTGSSFKLLLSVLPIAACVGIGHQILQQANNPVAVVNAALFALGWFWCVVAARRPFHWMLNVVFWMAAGLYFASGTKLGGLVGGETLPSLLFPVTAAVWIALWLAKGGIHPVGISLTMAGLLALYFGAVDAQFVHRIQAWLAYTLASHLALGLTPVRHQLERVAGVRLSPYATRPPWRGADRWALLLLAVTAVIFIWTLKPATHHNAINTNPDLQPLALSGPEIPLVDATPLAKVLAQQSGSRRDLWLQDPMAFAAIGSVQTTHTLAEIIEQLDPNLVRSRVHQARPLIHVAEELARSDYGSAIETTAAVNLNQVGYLIAMRGLLACAEDRPLDAARDMKTLYSVASLTANPHLLGIANRLGWSLFLIAEGRRDWLINIDHSMALAMAHVESPSLLKPIMEVGRERGEWDIFQLLKLAVAAQQFQLENQHWPADIEAMMPGFLKKHRMPIMRGFEFYLEPSDNGIAIAQRRIK